MNHMQRQCWNLLAFDLISKRKRIVFGSILSKRFRSYRSSKKVPAVQSFMNISRESSNKGPDCTGGTSQLPVSDFSPKKALVLAKFSRLEFEKRRNSHLSEEELADHLNKHGSDYKRLVYHHKIHETNRQHIVKCLQDRNIDTKVVNRFDYTYELIDWSDMIVTSGGDGTYLMAANKVNDVSKPLIGVNSDPSRSVGHLCLPKCYSNNFQKALDLILAGKFEWMFRHRIRITLEGENAYDEPIELHDQQLNQREFRFFDLDSLQSKPKNVGSLRGKSVKKRVLPYLALNEVFIGESLSSRVSYFEMAIDDRQKFKIKSSGATICTGTGSTSWFFNINKLTTQCVSNLFTIINEECFNGQNEVLTRNDPQLIQRVTNRFNNSLTFSPSKLLMAYVIRDPVVYGTNFTGNPRDFANKIVIKSRMTDAHVVIDGGLSYAFNDGAKATFEMHEQDALRTIKLKDCDVSPSDK